jgi:branched-chain amino acid transport system ATP-binding protein
LETHPEERVAGQADYLPEAAGPPVAAGPEIEPLHAQSARLKDGRVRRPVPTPRQAELGMTHPGLDETVLPAAAEQRPGRPPLGQRTRTYVRTINPRSIPGPKMPIIVMGLSAMFAGWDDIAFGLIAPELRAEFGLSIQTLVTFGSVTGFLALIGSLPAGYLVDRVKRVRLVQVGVVGSNVVTFMQALATGQAMYFGARLLGMVSGVVSGPASFPLMADYYPSRARARVVAFVSVIGSLGHIVGLPVAGYLIVAYGWRSAVLVLAVPGVICGALAFLLKEPVRGGMDRLELGLSRHEAATPQEPPTWQEAMRSAWAIRTLRRNAYAATVMQFTIPVNVVIGLIQAEKFFLDAGQRATLAMVQTILSIPALMLGSAFADRLLAVRPAGIVAFQGGIFFFSATVTIINGFAPNIYVFLVFGVLLAVANGMLLPASTAISTLVVPARVRGLGMQVFVPFQLIGLVVGPALVGMGQRLPLQQAVVAFAPFYVIGGLIILSTASTIERDIRAARAAAAATEEVRRAQAVGTDKILVCRDVDVAYDGVQILFNVDLDVQQGECLALLGTNGAGKSTLLRAIAGVHQADNGAIFFDGREVTHVPAHQNAQYGSVMMPGGAAVFPSMTVRENLTTAGWMRKDEGEALETSIEEVLGFFPILRDRMDAKAGTLSGGEQQMLALGQAFLMQPRLLMIDELSLGLAPAVIQRLLEILRGIRANGTTVILVEQSLNVALTIAERAVFMEKGEIRFDGPTEELLKRPDLIRSIFMGGSIGGAVPRGRRTARPTAADAPTPALEVRSAAVAFGGVRALHDVSFSVAPGEVVGIIGPNGAGKTTLFDVVSGYVRPDAGEVLLDGEAVSGLSPDARARLGLGRAFQSARLFPPLTVRENIALAHERRASKSSLLAAFWAPPVRESERRIAARVEGYIEVLGLDDFADKFVSELSTGTRRAVEVACQMAAEPKMLLLDEPSSGLAQAETEALGPALTRIVRETGCGLLVIEHDLPLITSMSDRLIAMELGEVVAMGSPEAVTTDQRVLRSYLAASNDVIERSGSRVGHVLSVLASSEKGNNDGPDS